MKIEVITLLKENMIICPKHQAVGKGEIKQIIENKIEEHGNKRRYKEWFDIQRQAFTNSGSKIHSGGYRFSNGTNLISLYPW